MRRYTESRAGDIKGCDELVMQDTRILSCCETFDDTSLKEKLPLAVGRGGGAAGQRGMSCALIPFLLFVRQL